MISINQILKKIAKKFLLIPKVKSIMVKICQFYTYFELKSKSNFYEILKSELLGIKENFTVGDGKALEKVVQMVHKEKMMIVEVGSWKGFSTSVLAKALADYNGKIFAVDHWMGNEGTWNYEIAKAQDIYSIFKHNMLTIGIWDMVYPLVMDSQVASQIFADGILDLVFIDADHRYGSIKKDISSWFPKLRDGGILCGHDCEGDVTRNILMK